MAEESTVPGRCICCRFRPETFAAVIPVANVTEPLRRASQLKRVQSCPPATVFAALPVPDEPAAAAPPQAATTRTAVSTKTEETFIGTVPAYPAGFGTNLGSAGTAFRARKNPSWRGR